MTQRKKLKQDYRDACNAYLRAFCEKHGYSYGSPDTWWVGDDAGGIAVIGDYTVDMATIRTDIDLDAPEPEFLAYYDYCIRATNLDISVPNFRSWVQGCPRRTEKSLARLERMKERVKNAIDEGPF
jgi:hypothetical protein